MRLAGGLASALTAVHGAGIVHRDLKPANVMLVSGEPVVIDFGIAQALDSTRLTQSGMLMGTPGYLAPEVIEGSPSGPAADVHSWAATIAFAATGRPPFGSGSYEAIFYRIVNGQPDLATMPATLLPVVLHALARDPSRRPSAAELAERIAALDPAALVPDLAPTIPPGMSQPDPRTRTYVDPRQAPGAAWGGAGRSRQARAGPRPARPGWGWPGPGPPAAWARPGPRPASRWAADGPTPTTSLTCCRRSSTSRRPRSPARRAWRCRPAPSRGPARPGPGRWVPARPARASRGPGPPEPGCRAPARRPARRRRRARPGRRWCSR